MGKSPWSQAAACSWWCLPPSCGGGLFILSSFSTKILNSQCGRSKWVHVGVKYSYLNVICSGLKRKWGGEGERDGSRAPWKRNMFKQDQVTRHLCLLVEDPRCRFQPGAAHVTPIRAALYPRARQKIWCPGVYTGVSCFRDS